jgi:hypothetical protein
MQATQVQLTPEQQQQARTADSAQKQATQAQQQISNNGANSALQQLMIASTFCGRFGTQRGFEGPP